MEITIFAKNRTGKDGKAFTSYLSRLPRKDGGVDTVTVKFREDCGTPRSCPCNIVVEKNDANVAISEYTDRETGEVRESRTLWVSAWTPGTEYIDHSLDEYDV